MRTVSFSLSLLVAGMVVAATTAARDPDPPAPGTIAGRIVLDGGRAAEFTDLVVYLQGGGLPSGGAAGQPAILDQRDITFAPHVLPVVAGSKVQIRNSDGITHNVHTRGRLNRPFNKTQVGGMSMVVDYATPEVVTVSCDIHSQMSAYIVVVPNRYFTKVNRDGTYSIGGVPAGRYELVVWHEKHGATTTPIEVTEGGTTQPVVKLAATS